MDFNSRYFIYFTFSVLECPDIACVRQIYKATIPSKKQTEQGSSGYKNPKLVFFFSDCQRDVAYAARKPKPALHRVQSGPQEETNSQ